MWLHRIPSDKAVYNYNLLQILHTCKRFMIMTLLQSFIKTSVLRSVLLQVSMFEHTLRGFIP